MSFKLTDNPQESRGFTERRESWVETGGGARFHHIRRSYDEDRDRAPVGLTEDWGSPNLWAVIPRSDTDGQPRASSSVALICKPLTGPNGVGLEGGPELTAARADLAALPLGPRIRGPRHPPIRSDPRSP